MRSRLYRRRVLQLEPPFEALAKIYESDESGEAQVKAAFLGSTQPRRETWAEVARGDYAVSLPSTPL